MEKKQDDLDNSPIEEVRLTVPPTDDPTLSALTFRTWVLGFTSCVILSFIRQFFSFRRTTINVPASCVQLLVLPVGRFMAKTLPTKKLRIPFTKLTVSMNPGPFNVKEHVLISIFAYQAMESPYALEYIIQMKVFYHRTVDALPAMLLMYTTQLMGYGFAGLFMKFIVESPYMWWPSSLIDVSFYRALHEVELRSKGQLRRLQFLLIVCISSFAYYIVPGYFFPSITTLSFICWIWKNSVTAQQIGSGFNGLGLGSISLDWSSIGNKGSPLAFPLFVIFNMMGGFVLVFYVLVPLSYWTNSYGAKKFSIFSSDLFDSDGQTYNISRIIDAKRFKFDQVEYDNYSPINLSIIMPYVYGFAFANVTATFTHAVLYHGRSVWNQYKDASGGGGQKTDIHNRLMKKYNPVPQWWFFALLISMVIIAIYIVEGFGGQLQLPYWGVILACVIVLIFLLPVAVLAATTSQVLSFGVLPEMVLGYVYPGRPAALVTFKSYAMTCMGHAVDFLYAFKVGHYMKIPPRSMFIAQMVSTIVSCTVSFSTTWWLMSAVENLCDASKLPVGSPWACPGQKVIFSSINVWGLIGPSRVFAPEGKYVAIYLFFLAGILATILVWKLSHMFPEKKWIKLIHVPIIFSSLQGIPYIKPSQIWSWFLVGIFFNGFIYNVYKGWWSKYNYVLSSGLDAGIAFNALLLSLLQFQGIYGVEWWGQAFDDHCPLAQCPTAPGIKVEGCPVF